MDRFSWAARVVVSLGVLVAPAMGRAQETPAPDAVTEAPIIVDAPESAVRGAPFSVSWSETLGPRDYVTVVPADADEPTVDNHVRTGETTQGMLVAPADPGAYEVRYVDQQDRRVLGRDPLTVTDAEVTLTVPATALAGARFAIDWSRTINTSDYVTILPADAPEGEFDIYVRAGSDARELRAPGTPGNYQVRYMLNEGGRTITAVPITITEPSVTLTAPDSVVAGAVFDVDWTAAVDARDTITIVAPDTPPGSYEEYLRGDSEDRTLIAPARAGDYEVRYILDQGERVLARKPIAVTEPAITVTAPAQVMAGARVPVDWSESVNGRDFITIAPSGAPAGVRSEYVRAESERRTLTAPATPGEYEVRYVLAAGPRTVASTPVTVTDPPLEISAPDTALVGATIPVQWSMTVNARDAITIAPANTPVTESVSYLSVDASEQVLRAPADAGLYEVRYVLASGERVLARTPIEILAADITLAVPERLRTGDSVRVEWTGQSPHPRDYITIVPESAPEGDYGDLVRVGTGGPVTLATPAEPGRYEVRYMLDRGDRALASAPLEVLPADAPVSSGGTLQAPATAAKGAQITVAWSVSAPAEDVRVALARTEQADFTWLAVKAASQTPLTFTMPQSAGRYELRLLDLAGQKVLGRTTVRVE